MSQTFGTFSTILISEDLPCEIVPSQSQEAWPFTAEEEAFFDAGLALTAAAGDDGADTLGNLASQRSALSSRSKALVAAGLGFLVGVVSSSWSRARPRLVRAVETLGTLAASLWSKARLSRADTVGFGVRPAAARVWRRSPNDEAVGRRIRRASRRGRHTTLTGYPALSRES